MPCIVTLSVQNLGSVDKNLGPADTRVQLRYL